MSIQQTPLIATDCLQCQSQCHPGAQTLWMWMIFTAPPRNCQSERFSAKVLQALIEPVMQQSGSRVIADNNCGHI